MSDEEIRNQEMAYLEGLFRQEYEGLLRTARSRLKKHDTTHVCASDRAEDIVQDLFFLAWEKREKVMSSQSPVGWLYTALSLKVREAIREEFAWMRNLNEASQLTGSVETTEKLPDEWSKLIPPEDLRLLSRLYLEGYTYKELCAELGLKKSALAMRIFRIKREFRENYGKLYPDL